MTIRLSVHMFVLFNCRTKFEELVSSAENLAVLILSQNAFSPPVINTTGFIILSLKGLNSPEYSYFLPIKKKKGFLPLFLPPAPPLILFFIPKYTFLLVINATGSGETIPPNFVQMGSVVEENGHAGRQR